MNHPRILLVCMALLALLWSGAVQALPTVDQVQAAAQRGDYAGAEKMMREVVAAKPGSARAQYVLAEILAHRRQFDEAAEHTRRARALDPAIKFTDAAKFNAFEQLLQREQAAAARATAPAPLEAAPPPPQRRTAPAQAADAGGTGVPVWLLGVGAIAFIALAASWMRRRNAAPAQPAMAGAGSGMPGGYGPGGMVPPGMGAGGGSGLMGVGLAAAGGVAAGMLAERMLHGHDERNLPRDQAAPGGGGLLPGSFGGGDADGFAQQLAERDIDFGSGNGWDASGGDFGGGGGDDW